jgi:ABC-type uncharacterized transport system auxiliary subunit
MKCRCDFYVKLLVQFQVVDVWARSNKKCGVSSEKGSVMEAEYQLTSEYAIDG